MLKIIFDDGFTLVSAVGEEIVCFESDDEFAHRELTRVLNETQGKRGGPGYVYVPDTQENREALQGCKWAI